ncbi:MAG: DNA-directed RNA polymerase subunit beta [Candidatus Omnitrophica bacterium]|nr:DNA-directed RNA polymerase subunit beta [Candidatus Omnitrophota bacterium]
MYQRKNFGRIQDVMELPYLIEIQTESYDKFLQANKPKNKRENAGLQEIFLEIFPIEGYDKNARLEFLHYFFGKPKYDAIECLRRGMTYAYPLKVRLRLKTAKESREQDVYFGELPIMTENGTFIINGDERVAVSQLHRSPGVSFEETRHPNGKKIFSARIIPARGAWVEFEFDMTDILYAYIDRKRKVLSTTLLKALGYSEEGILKAFFKKEKIDSSDKEALKILPVNSILASDIVVPSSSQILFHAFEKITTQMINKILNAEIKSFEIFRITSQEIINTLDRDRTKTQEDALFDIYRRVRPGEPPTVEVAQGLVDRLFFDRARYDLSKVGRYMLNRKLGKEAPLEQRTLTPETLIDVMVYLINLKNGQGISDDIDHLGNRRIRTVGELLQNQFRIGLVRLERSVKERMGVYDMDVAMPQNLVNSKLISAVVRDFFGRSQLSQFMDQTNPLAELTHKRRLSALGPGGLSRERAGFEVRDVHHSHYGRICPIETPEGQNIGLIASLSTYAKVNEYGFIETPYRKVVNGRVTDRIEYLTADREDLYVIAQANAKIDKNGSFMDERIDCRHRGDFPKVEAKRVDFMDVSPRQLVSIAASLIPFLEHDDANRALMGSNMQRQAVPLLVTEPPFVGTGIEYRAAKDSGSVIIARNSGAVKHVQADEIVIDDDVYHLRKFIRSNASTCINQRPIVRIGQKVRKGEVIADGASTSQGELALGRNVLAAFMPWRGYNFEDAILISEKLLKEDVYTSIHIEEFEIEARDTRLGNEDITRDIPNVGEEALKDLDESGIVRIGAEVGPGDILVGKVTPKSETELSPEEKLLRAIFGEKAQDVRDASLTVPPGIEGIVVDVKVFSRKGPKPTTKEEMAKEAKQIESIKHYYKEQIEDLKEDKFERLCKLALGKKVRDSILDDETREILIAQDKVITKNDVKKLEGVSIEGLNIVEDEETNREIERVARILDSQIMSLIDEEEREIDKLKRGDELPPGVIKKAVVYVVSKKKLSVGDKIAGRHGNKGVIAKILPEEDMPFMPDGTPVEIVLNPLGVPSRMNVGQILETHLGWAAQALGIYAASPIFDGASESEIKEYLKKAGLPEDGKTVLYDGLTGEPLDQRVAVGYIYMMKLAHLVDDKIHARSIGPYSLVTQQPLGGKAQFGGQRFGEMEVWALEAYGAAYALQELLTVKSDDVVGRTRIYETIVKGENALKPSTPESFNVLVKELQSLALDVRTRKI